MNIGFGSQVPWWKVAAILNCSRTEKPRRLIEAAEIAGRLSDATKGRRRRSLVLLEGGLVILSAVSPETLMKRLNQLSQKGEEPDDPSKND
jgi:hypothetical protein